MKRGRNFTKEDLIKSKRRTNKPGCLQIGRLYITYQSRSRSNCFIPRKPFHGNTYWIAKCSSPNRVKTCLFHPLFPLASGKLDGLLDIIHLAYHTTEAYTPDI